MPRRTSIRADLGVEDLERRYRATRDPVARSQWQIVWLLAQGEPSERVAAVTGYALTWVRTVARRYNADGEAGIGDRRHANRGGTRLLTPEQEAVLDPAVVDPAVLDPALAGSGAGWRTLDGGAGRGVDRGAARATGGSRDRLALSTPPRLAALSSASAARQS
jgi:hypothetical protein